MDQLDRKLLENFRKGDGHALDRIYDYYRIPVLRFTASVIKDEQEAESIYHNAFLKILRKKEGIKPELNFNSYVFTVVKNEIFDYLKAIKKSHAFKEKYWNRIQEERHAEEDHKEDALNKLEVLVKALSPKRRKILEMNFFEEKSYLEIAEALNISKNTVKNQLVKAKFILRREME